MCVPNTIYLKKSGQNTEEEKVVRMNERGKEGSISRTKATVTGSLVQFS